VHLHVGMTLDQRRDHLDHQHGVLLILQATRIEDVDEIAINALHWARHLVREFALGVHAGVDHPDPLPRHAVTVDRLGQVVARLASVAYRQACRSEPAVKRVIDILRRAADEIDQLP